MLHLNIWYVNIIELMKGIDNGKKISIISDFSYMNKNIQIWNSLAGFN